MNPEYKDIFDKRGGAYHKAMEGWPTARRAEFDALFAQRPLKSGDVLIDIPAGGGYLGGFLPKGVDYIPREITAGFSPDTPVVEWDGDWDAPAADRVVSCAACHHFEDHQAHFDHCLAALKPGGVVHIADADVLSPLCAFLDEFVGAHTPTGHHGNFLPAPGDPFYAPYAVARCETVATPWRFPSLKDAGAFCIALFGLTIDDGDRALDALRDYGIGVVENDDGATIDWRLTYIDIINA